MSRPYSSHVRGDARRSDSRYARNPDSASSTVTDVSQHEGYPPANFPAACDNPRIRRIFSRIKQLWVLARSERASPRQIGWAVAVGVFAGCSPAVGFHGWVALGLATVLRLNRLFCWIGSRICSVVTLPFVVFAEIQTGTWLRTGHFLPLTATDALARGPALILDWCIGFVPVGAVLGALLGLLGYGLALRRTRRARANEVLRAPPDRSG
jgi:uncharacterized protein (DUF2062 family)